MTLFMYFSCPKVLLLSLLLFLFVSVCFSACSAQNQIQTGHVLLGRRRVLESEDPPLKKKATSPSAKNQTKLNNSGLSSKNQTKTIKSSNLISSKNHTKLAKASSVSTKTTPTPTLPNTGLKIKKLNSTTIKIKKLNSTSIKIKQLNSTSKALNSNKTTSGSNKKSIDLLKQNGPSVKNKTPKAADTKESKIKADKKLVELESEKPNKNQKAPEKKSSQQKPRKQTQPSWIEDDDVDFVTELKDLPSNFQQTLIPDLERISKTSKAYITKYNKEITKGFKPYVGNKYAPTIATVLCFAFILIPLLLVSLIFNRIKAYFSLQKLLIFIQVYLSIYFSILCLSSLVTGLEPLKFFYATSQSTYVCLQVLQTLGYVLYLLLLLMYLILVFSTECGMGSRFLGLAQTFVGFAVGLHYYVTVFHRVVLRQPPKTNWKIHGIYATCFLLTCLFAGADRRKKTYLEDGGGEGKKN